MYLSIYLSIYLFLYPSHYLSIDNPPVALIIFCRTPAVANRIEPNCRNTTSKWTQTVPKRAENGTKGPQGRFTLGRTGLDRHGSAQKGANLQAMSAPSGSISRKYTFLRRIFTSKRSGPHRNPPEIASAQLHFLSICQSI